MSENRSLSFFLLWIFLLFFFLSPYLLFKSFDFVLTGVDSMRDFVQFINVFRMFVLLCYYLRDEKRKIKGDKRRKKQEYCKIPFIARAYSLSIQMMVKRSRSRKKK